MKYNTHNFSEIINFINNYIKKNNISINSISKKLKISNSHLKKILDNKIYITAVNPIEILDVVINNKRNLSPIKKYKLAKETQNDKNLNVKLLEDNLSTIKRSYAKIILFFLNVLSEIANYEFFFKHVLYLTDEIKIKRFNSVTFFLENAELIHLKNTIMEKGVNYSLMEVEKRSKSYFLTNALEYLMSIYDMKNAYLCSLWLNNKKNSDFLFMEYAYEIFNSNNSKQIIQIMKEYFSWLKSNRKRKSQYLKIFYISILINYFNNINNLTNVVLYSFYFFKYIPVKNNLFSYSCNKNYNINNIYKFEKYFTKETTTLSYLIFCVLIIISLLYFKFDMHAYYLYFNNYILNQMNKSDYYLPYFYETQWKFHLYYGSLKNFSNLINDLEKNHSNSMNELLFYLKQLKYILLNDNKNLLKHEEKFIKSFDKSNFHISLLNNIFENHIFDLTIKMEYSKIIFLLSDQDIFSKHKPQYNKLNYIALLFILIFKNINKNKTKDFINFNKITTITNDPFYLLLKKQDMDQITKRLKPFLFSKNNNPTQKLISCPFFYIKFFELYISLFLSLKSKYQKAQQNLATNKEVILSSMRKKLVQDGYLKKNSKKNPDIVSTFINKYPEDNEILKLFHQENLKEDVFNTFIFIQEYNFIFHFINQMICDFYKYEKYNIPKEDRNKKPLLWIDEEKIKKMENSQFNFNSYITNYFENYLLELEQKREEIQSKIDSTEQGESINMTEQLMSLFNNDVNDRFLRFTKAYILAKY